MRLTTFINESSEINHANVVDILLRNCMPFMRDMGYDKTGNKTKHLLSGRENTKLFFEGKIRNDRNPKDTPRWLHDMVDNEFQKKFGVKPRSNSIFTIGDYQYAISYGYSVYIIIPKGKYNIIWSDDINDLYTSLKSAYKDILNISSPYDFSWNVENLLDHVVDDQEVSDYVEEMAEKEWIKYYGEDTKGGVWTYSFEENYHPDELRDMGVAGKKRDIFIKGFDKERVKDILIKNYGHVIPANLHWSPDITLDDFIYKNYDKFEKEFNKHKLEEINDEIYSNVKDLINTYVKSDIKNAIKSNNEIMLMSSEGYCAINMNRSGPNVYEPIFDYFKKYGFRTIKSTIKKIGQSEWDDFKETHTFIDGL